VKIELPKLLLEHRRKIVELTTARGQGRLERLGFRLWAWLMRHPRLFEFAGMAGAAFPPGLLNFGPVRAWTSQRELPPLAERSFRRLWRERRRGS
jgi:L-lactate dehydrogenase complex protein LldF